MCVRTTEQGGETLQEIWKPIEGYEGRYEISNFGRVKSFVVNRKAGRLINPIRTKLGYRTVRLYDGDGGSSWIPVHRLVALAFIPNPCNYPEVNHKDEVKDHNSMDNLEWCDRTYNVNYGTRIQRVSDSHINNEFLSKKVCSVDETGQIEYFDSIAEAERQTGCSHSNIVRTLKGRTSHCGNRQWFYS